MPSLIALDYRRVDMDGPPTLCELVEEALTEFCCRDKQPWERTPEALSVQGNADLAAIVGETYKELKRGSEQQLLFASYAHTRSVSDHALVTTLEFMAVLFLSFEDHLVERLDALSHERLNVILAEILNLNDQLHNEDRFDENDCQFEKDTRPCPFRQQLERVVIHTVIAMLFREHSVAIIRSCD